MNQPQFIKHKGKKILYVDFSNVELEHKIELVEIIRMAQRIIGSQLPNSLLVLTNVHNTKYDSDVAQVMKTYVAHNKPYVKKSAVIGLGGLQIVLYNVIMRFTGRQIASFDSEEKAKDWLVADDD